MKRTIAMLLCLCMILIGGAKAFTEHTWEQWLPDNIEMYSPGKIKSEGVIFWSAEDRSNNHFYLHSIELESGIVESYDLLGYLVQSDASELGVLYATQYDRETTLYRLLPDGSTEEILSIQNVDGISTTTGLNCSILAYHKGYLFYSYRYTDEENMINYKLMRTDQHGNHYTYRLENYVYCISEDGLLAKVDEDKGCILVESPIDGSIGVFSFPDLKVVRCLAWYDAETLLFMSHADGSRQLSKLNVKSGEYEKVLTQDGKEIQINGSFHRMIDVDSKNNLLTLMYPSADESGYYCFPLLLDMKTGERYILGYPMVTPDGEDEAMPEDHRVIIQR